jgi:hypothetical protein
VERDKLKAKERAKAKKIREIEKKKIQEALKKEKEKEKIRNQKKREREKERRQKRQARRRAAEVERRRKKREEERKPKPINYRIVLCSNGKQYRKVGEFHKVEDAYAAFKKAKEESENIKFPRMMKIHDDMQGYLDECLLLERTDKGPAILRNEYGKLVEHRTNLEGWEIMDKFETNVEETFWVWGFDCRSDRKTFEWIYDEMLIRDGFSAYEFRRVFTFRNKLMIRYDDGSLGMVICKSAFDSVRLYNELQRKAREDKVKEIVFTGDRSSLNEYTDKLVDEIMDLTGWTRDKALMSSTSFYRAK